MPQRNIKMRKVRDWIASGMTVEQMANEQCHFWAGNYNPVALNETKRNIDERETGMDVLRMATKLSIKSYPLLTARFDVVEKDIWSIENPDFNPAWILKVTQEQQRTALQPWRDAGWRTELGFMSLGVQTIDVAYFTKVAQAIRGTPMWYCHAHVPTKTLWLKSLCIDMRIKEARDFIVRGLADRVKQTGSTGVNLGLKPNYWDTGYTQPMTVPTEQQEYYGPAVIHQSPYQPGEYAHLNAEMIRALAAEGIYVATNEIPKPGIPRWQMWERHADLLDIPGLLIGEGVYA